MGADRFHDSDEEEHTSDSGDLTIGIPAAQYSADFDADADWHFEEERGGEKIEMPKLDTAHAISNNVKEIKRSPDSKSDLGSGAVHPDSPDGHEVKKESTVPRMNSNSLTV